MSYQSMEEAKLRGEKENIPFWKAIQLEDAQERDVKIEDSWEKMKYMWQSMLDALDAYVQSQQKSMEHYLEDQYQIASAARVATVPTGEVVMVCCEDSDTVFENIKKALAA